MVKWVKPTGHMTPARPETAARLRNAAQATKRAVVWLGEKLVLVRIQWSHQFAPEWTVTMAVMASAAAGARRARAQGLRCTSERPEACCGFLGMPGARLRAWFGQAGLLVTASFVAAAAGSGRGGNHG